MTILALVMRVKVSGVLERYGSSQTRTDNLHEVGVDAHLLMGV
jgi:hypothetical protein